MQKEYGSKKDIFKAFNAISEKQMRKINFIASKQIHGTSYSEPLDLIHEALYRSLTEKRKWPKKVVASYKKHCKQRKKRICNNQ